MLHRYLVERVEHCDRLAPLDSAWEQTEGAFERALVRLHTMPVIWRMYCSFLARQSKITLARLAFDRGES